MMCQLGTNSLKFQGAQSKLLYVQICLATNYPILLECIQPCWNLKRQKFLKISNILNPQTHFVLMNNSVNINIS
jgi:hypothetical protein